MWETIKKLKDRVAKLEYALRKCEDASKYTGSEIHIPAIVSRALAADKTKTENPDIARFLD